MRIYQGNIKTCHVFRVEKSGDLLAALEKFVTERNVRWGTLSAIGAVEHAVIGYFNQASREYEQISYDDDLEITSCIGNISLKEGKPFVHAHITLGDRQGNVIGGHLMPGTIIFACEVVIYQLDGEPPVRQDDPETNLFLWR